MWGLENLEKGERVRGGGRREVVWSIAGTDVRRIPFRVRRVGSCVDDFLSAVCFFTVAMNNSPALCHSEFDSDPGVVVGFAFIVFGQNMFVEAVKIPPKRH